MTRLRTQAACLASAERDLRLHKLPRVAKPVDVDDAEQFPNIAQARAEFAALPAEERERLNREWEG